MVDLENKFTEELANRNERERAKKPKYEKPPCHLPVLHFHNCSDSGWSGNVIFHHWQNFLVYKFSRFEDGLDWGIKSIIIWNPLSFVESSDDEDDDEDEENENFDIGQMWVTELDRKKKHPDRLHTELWFNEPGEVYI